tara:strand:- start:773 stop:1186 length:414 start_codon:yes stop_codon:yes gene_type:complete
MAKKNNYEDDRSWFDWLFSSVDSGRYIQSQKDLKKITSNADPNHEFAALFDEHGQDIFGDYRNTYYRHLNPADSTVSYVQGHTPVIHSEGYEDSYGYGYPSYDDNAMNYARKNIAKGDTLSSKDMALKLAKHRWGKK